MLLGPGGANGASPAAEGVPGPLPPELIEAIVQALVTTGQQALAEAFFVALQGGQAPVGPAETGPGGLGQTLAGPG